MCEYPADHILRGEAELKSRRYLGDEMEGSDAMILTEEDAAEVREETGKAARIGDGQTTPEPESVRPGTDQFLAVLDEIRALHLRKTLDYGCDEDALSNIRSSADVINVAPWAGCILRISDKMHRLRAFFRRGRVEFDGITDTLLDIACYAIIALVLYRERAASPPAGTAKRAVA